MVKVVKEMDYSQVPAFRLAAWTEAGQIKKKTALQNMTLKEVITWDRAIATKETTKGPGKIVWSASYKAEEARKRILSTKIKDVKELLKKNKSKKASTLKNPKPSTTKKPNMPRKSQMPVLPPPVARVLPGYH